MSAEETFEGPVTLRREGATGTITIDRPEQRNAVNPEVVAGLRAALAAAEADDAIRALVLTGAGDKAFCAGGDLGGMSGGDGKVAEHYKRAEIADLFRALRASRLPVVARVNGHALAGGFGLMLACDLVVAAEEAELGTPEVNIGLWPFMISAIIQKDVPRKVALELMLTGARIPASEGARWGFVNRVVPRAELDGAVAEMVEAIATKSPLIVALGKGSFYRSENQPFDSALDHLAGMLTLALQSEDTIEGVTAFVQKRDPQWKGR
ncbi:MAG TPA: enoyl-CoA hydratase-related protein [Actinomycetota bacterium]|nr:enoyl-CoA hydratase-related protein [Actinomycetota bacterium]